MGNTGSSNGTVIRPPMKIHQIHGKNLTISHERLVAKRHEGYSDGLFFGSRPVFHSEKLEITVMKIISEWNGAMRFGFTTHNPVNIIKHAEGIPRYMCPDLIKRGGSYVETISQISLREKDKIVFWLEPNGDVCLKVNDVNQKCQIHGIQKDVWPVVDVYGNTTEVSFRSLEDNIDHISPPTAPRIYSLLYLMSFDLCSNPESVDLINSNTVIRSREKKAFAWSQVPLNINTVWALFVNDVDHNIGNNLSLAILKVAPQLKSLPEKLSDFPRGLCWVFNNVYTRMMAGDELAICISDNGSVLVAINGEKFEELGKVSPNQPYYLLVDLNCSLISLSSIGIFPLSRYQLPILPAINKAFEFDATQPQSFSLGAASGGDMSRAIPRQSFTSPVPELLKHASLKEAESSFKDLSIGKNNSNKGAECVVCLDSTPDNVFIPCGHVCCCKACADNMMNEHGNHLCPACRKKIEHSYKVYL